MVAAIVDMNAIPTIAISRSVVGLHRRKHSLRASQKPFRVASVHARCHCLHCVVEVCEAVGDTIDKGGVEPGL